MIDVKCLKMWLIINDKCQVFKNVVNNNKW